MSDPSSGIDNYVVYPYFPSGDHTLYFRMAAFETFTQQSYVSSLQSHAVILDYNMAEGCELLAGSGELPSPEFILVSDKVGDDLIKTSGMGFVDDYSDLLGMTCTVTSYAGKSLRIGGVVESGEHAIYMDEMLVAKDALQATGNVSVMLASDFGLKLGAGEAVVALSDGELKGKAPSVGSDVEIQGLSLKVKDLLVRERYDEWVDNKLGRDEYFASIVPDDAQLEEYVNEHYFEYDAYYYDQLDSYIREQYVLDTYSFENWIYVVKGFEEVKYLYVSTDFYKAEMIKAKQGRYPTKEEYDAVAGSLGNFELYELGSMNSSWYKEFETGRRPSIYYTTCLVSDEDYIKISKSVGNTDELFENSRDYFTYTQIHSFDPALTEAFLTEKFGDREIEYYESIITPEMVLGMTLAYEEENVIAYLISLLLILAVMSVCMFFIMRSSLMSRIKEIGIYRAIGVSKRNIILRFGVEATLLSATTVVIGYLASGIFIRALEHVSPNAETIFYYPTWYALIVLAVLFGLTLLCGILPVMNLLRKTPSEILAKYDV